MSTAWRHATSWSQCMFQTCLITTTSPWILLLFSFLQSLFFLQLSLPSLYSSSKFTTKTLIISSSSLAFFSIRNTQSLIWDLLDNLELSFSLFLFDIVFVGSVSSTICLHLLGAFPPLLLKSAKWTPYYICFLFLHLLPLNLIDLASSKLGYFS